MPSPARTVVQSPRFGKHHRRLPAAIQRAADEVIRALLDNPLSGEPKVAALKGVRVTKFAVGARALLLAYRFDSKRNVLELVDIGPHENFYRDLQQYLDAR